MARPRAFDEEEILQKALMAFWEKGYEATSVGDLEQATGISRISLYNAFKDKEGVFLAVLDRYHAMAARNFDAMFQTGDLDAVASMFENISRIENTGTPITNGCLMVNTVLDFRSHSKAVQAKVKAYRALLIEKFEGVLRAAQSKGQLENNFDIHTNAEFLQGSLWGALANIRLSGDTTMVGPMLSVVVKTIRSWRLA